MSSVEPATSPEAGAVHGPETSVAGGGPAEAGLEAAAALADLGSPGIRADATEVASSAPVGLWKNRDFKFVLFRQGISAFGDAITFTALPLLVVFLTGSGVAMGDRWRPPAPAGSDPRTARRGARGPLGPAPDELLGRVGSTARTISLGLSPIGVFTGGVLLDLIGGARAMLVISVASLLVTGVFALSGTMRAAVAGSGRR